MRKVGEAQVYDKPPGGDCQFEVYHREHQKMGPCGERAYGRIGKTELCKEHFYYLCGIYGIGPKDIGRVRV